MDQRLTLGGGPGRGDGAAASLPGWAPSGHPFALTDDDSARLARYAEARAFADGAQWPAGRPPRRGETRLTLNYARALVRKVASYVFPSTVTFSVSGPAGQTAQWAPAAEAALNGLTAALDLGALDLSLCVEQAVIGDAALKVTWDPAARQPRVTGVDPATLFVWWSPAAPRLAARVAQVYQMPGHALPAAWRTRLGGVVDGGWYVVAEDWSAERWRVTAGGAVLEDRANPYGWLPFVFAPNDPRPHEFWGRSDLTDLYDVCRELNQRMTTLGTILTLAGAPITVLENVTGSEGITVGPGAKWELPEGAKAYLLDLLAGGGGELHLGYVTQLYRAMHDLAEVPRTAFGDSGRSLSGAALEVEIQPLVQKVRRKRRAWDAVYRERNHRLLDLLERFGGVDVGGLRQTVALWPEVLPSDAESQVRMEKALVDANIRSRQTAAARLGADDPAAEFQRVQQELAALNGVEIGS